MVSTRSISEGGPEQPEPRDPNGSVPPDNGPATPARETAPRILSLRGGRGVAAPVFEQLPLPDGIEALYYEGMASYQHRRWEEALDRFTRLKELQPTRPGLDALLDEVRWFLQLQAAAPAGGIPRAETSSRRTTGRGWRSAGGPARARAVLYVVLAMFALGGLLLVAFGDRLPWRGNPAAAELFNRGEARLAVGDYEGAQAAFEKMLEVAPGDPEAKLGLDRAQRQQVLAQGYAAAEAAIAEEDWSRASAELSNILAVDPYYLDAQAQFAFVGQRQRLADLYADGGRLYDLGEWEQALKQFKRLRNIDAAYRADTLSEFLFVCYLNAGEALIRAEGASQDDVRAAVNYFGEALAIHPRNRSASDARRLGGLYLDALEAAKKGDHARATAQLSALVAEVPAYAGGQAAIRLYDLIVASAQDSLAAGDVPAAMDRFGRAQGLPVTDNSAARRGLALAQAATPTPSPTPPNTPTITPVPTPWASVVAGPVAVKSGPDGPYPAIGEVAQGAIVTITGRRDDGSWLRICCTADGKQGWVPSPRLDVRGPLKEAEVVSLPTATATRVVVVPTQMPRDTPTPAQSVCVQGSVLNVAGGGGLANWTVHLVDASGVERSWRTKESGFYRFSDLAEGQVTVKVDVPSNWRTVSPASNTIVVAPSPSCVIVDFWAEMWDVAASEPAPTPVR